MHIRAFGMSLVGFVPYFMFISIFILLPIFAIAVAFFLLRFIYRRLSTFVDLKSSFLSIVIVLTSLAAMANNASACSINTNLKPPPRSDVVDNADIVVIGQVMGGGFTLNGSTIRVEKYLKGSGPHILFTEGYSNDLMPSYCGIKNDFWSRKIYYFQDNAVTTNQTAAWKIWSYERSELADDATVTEISSYTGHLADPSPSPFKIHAAAVLILLHTEDFLFITYSCLIPLGSLLAVFLLHRVLHRRRKVKLPMPE